MQRVMLLVVLVVLLLAAGCATCPGVAPAGPGATSATNLKPWLRGAPEVTCTGELLYFHCTSMNGNFWTWALTPAADEDAAEVDVRACADAAKQLEDHRVTITGKLIYREPRHFPILVAERIESAEAPASTTSSNLKLAALDRELDILLGM